MPDLDLSTANGELRVFSLMHGARPLLLSFGAGGEFGPANGSDALGGSGALGGFDVTPWADRVQLIAGNYTGTWELPAIGQVPAPAAVLIRPDGHVAWVGDGTPLGLADALTTWFGQPASGASGIQPPR
jgi:3-(3-hydroxy-phenyl)propionate hydroxylase